MANNWSLRRSMVTYSENIQDASERLRHFAGLNNFIDTHAISSLMNSLSTARTTDLDSAITRAETSITTMEALLDVLKNQKKLKNAENRLQLQQESVMMKEAQKRERLANMAAKANPHRHEWRLPDEDMDQ